MTTTIDDERVAAGALPLRQCRVISQQLQRHHVQDRRQISVMLRQPQRMDLFCLREMAVRIGENIQLAASGLDFLEVGLELVEQAVVGRDGNDRHIAVDQRERAMLEFAGSISLGVDVGDFLELERAFKGDRQWRPRPRKRA